MSRLQTDPERICRVAKDYQAEFADPIAVEAIEAFTVSERTDAWESNSAWIWVWCTDQRGKMRRSERRVKRSLCNQADGRDLAASLFTLKEGTQVV